MLALRRRTGTWHRLESSVMGRLAGQEGPPVTGITPVTVDTLNVEDVAGHMLIDSYPDAGTLVALDLVNRLRVRPETESDETVLASVLASDASSAKLLRATDARGFRRLAGTLHDVFTAMSAGYEDDAAARLNRVLAAHPAYPHLAKETGRWRMHHTPRTPTWWGCGPRSAPSRWVGPSRPATPTESGAAPILGVRGSTPTSVETRADSSARRDVRTVSRLRRFAVGERHKPSRTPDSSKPPDDTNTVIGRWSQLTSLGYCP